jgi:hypothetical protein
VLRPARFLPLGKTRYPLYSRLRRLQGRSGQVRKISPPPGFDPRTVQPVAQSLYRLSYPAHIHCSRVVKLCKQFDEKRLVRPQARSGQVRKISPPPGFDPRTVRPVAQSLYRLSYPAHIHCSTAVKLCKQFDEKCT